MKDVSFIEKQYDEIISGIKPEWVSEWEPISEYLHTLPDWKQAIYLVVNLDNQVFNGGFHQYFTNGYGAFAEEAIKVLKMIGATDTANIVKQAYDIVNADHDVQAVFREKIFKKRYRQLIISDSLFEPLDRLDKAYANNGEDVIELLLSFVENNA
jgi:hypothetical protein